jgi:hypothetical protein
MTKLLLMGLLAATVGLAPAKSVATPFPTHSIADTSVQRAQGRPNVFRGTAEAFRTAGAGVVYGIRSVGRALTGRPHDVHDRARMYFHARQTREAFRGY